MAHYISKDFVHQGCGLILNPDEVWNFIPYSVQKNIKKAIRNNVRIEKVSGNSDDIEILRLMWYDYNDPNMPTNLNENEFMFIAYNEENEAIGAVILLPVGNHLFLNNLAGSKKGKSLGIQDYLLWHCVNYFKDSVFKYIDVGVSYRPMLYNFFKKWQTIAYPVIFNKPEYTIKISDKPFNTSIYKNPTENYEFEALELLKKLFQSEKITFIPNKLYAESILNELGFEVINNSLNFFDNKIETPFYIELNRLFSVQFGCILVNLEINDSDIWNKFHCLDVYKRQFTFSTIYQEINTFEKLIEKRIENYKKFEDYFLIEDISAVSKDMNIPEFFYFYHHLNEKYHNKLIEFEIQHFYDEKKAIIGLPVHQNISMEQIEYIYAIFRGILNLCSEWEHTDNYKEFKI